MTTHECKGVHNSSPDVDGGRLFDPGVTWVLELWLLIDVINWMVSVTGTSATALKRLQSNERTNERMMS